MMKLTSEDINRIVRACEFYKHETGSEYIWDQYQHHSEKLKYYKEENCPEEV